MAAVVVPNNSWASQVKKLIFFLSNFLFSLNWCDAAYFGSTSSSNSSMSDMFFAHISCMLYVNLSQIYEFHTFIYARALE